MFLPAGMPLINSKASLAKRTNFIIDSGTTFIIAPLASANEFYASISGSAKLDDNHWTFPCDSQPTLGFRFSSTSKKEFQINPDDFNLGYLSEDESRCVGAVVGQDLGLGTSWVRFEHPWYHLTGRLLTLAFTPQILGASFSQFSLLVRDRQGYLLTLCSLPLNRVAHHSQGTSSFV